ncbi:Cytoplasmic aconitate hydratase [Fragariocoptes setiger]|uniref:Cytoplasmic aconitate hydratase n=1 Tax=Fragariocoptes setiger TaxID=1670756 RepID=A0ABQ7S977_9ACAR|nr:Cytoplasmic aconitate hydratase [Fragariocoptes setiger]
MANQSANMYDSLKNALHGANGVEYQYYDLTKLDDRYKKLPISIKVLLEACIRNCDGWAIKQRDVEKLLDWKKSQFADDNDIPFKPARVIMQDLTGVAAIVDLAGLRDAFAKLEGDAKLIRPLCQVDLVIDHSVQVDFAKTIHSKLRMCQIASYDLSKNSSIKKIMIRQQHSRRPDLFFSTCTNCRLKQLASPMKSVSAYRDGLSSSDRRFAHNQTRSFTESTNNGFKHGAERNRVGAAELCDECDKLDYCKLARGFEKLGQESRTFGHHNSASGGVKFSKNGVVRLVWAGDEQNEQSRNEERDQMIQAFRTAMLDQQADSLQKNQDLEFERNKERFRLLKWAANSMENLKIFPPGSGIVHQVNLEFLSRVVCNKDNLLYPESCIGTDSHTTMVNGLGVVGFGVGGIEAEAVALGQAMSMPVPQVVGYKLTGELGRYVTSTDLVLTITKHLRHHGVVNKFVEFFGPGVKHLSLPDRATISNMSPEFGATISLFPVDAKTLDYLRQTGRDATMIDYVEAYLKAVGMFKDYENAAADAEFTEVLELDLGTVTPSVSGPKRPHDRVAFAEMKSDFESCLSAPVGFKGYGLSADRISAPAIKFQFNGEQYELSHGHVVIAALTSCTNTSNSSSMLAAGILAKCAVEKGLTVKPYIKTSLSPGSGVVTYYLRDSGLLPYLEKLGFFVTGYGCQSCIGNSGPLEPAVVGAIEKGDLICVSVLSGNRNYEGRVHPHTRANYLASPLIVVACALSGRIIDFEKEPLGQSSDGHDVYLREIWPTRDEIEQLETKHVLASMYHEVYKNIEKGNKNWSDLDALGSLHYPWDPKSNYIKQPFFFENIHNRSDMDNLSTTRIDNARVLLNLPDSVSTDMISPAGAISRTSPAYRYLLDRGVQPRDINSYGAYRGNDSIMIRGTFANIRLTNKLLGSVQKPRTLFLGTGEELDVFEASQKYREAGTPLIILAGKEYGCGSSRDWAAKGTLGLGVKAVIAESYERIHRSNLVGMGLIPLQFLEGQNADCLGLNGRELYTIDLGSSPKPRQKTTVIVSGASIDKFEAIVRFDTELEIEYFKNGGVLHYMLHQLLSISNKH